jgi:hypothetical protein
MEHLDELELNRSPEPPVADEPSDHLNEAPDRFKWILLSVALLSVCAALAYVALRRPAPQPAAAAVATPRPASPADAPALQGDKIALPPLQETDPLVRELVVKLSSHPAVLAWLATNGLIENFAVVTLNVSEGRTPVAHLRPLAPKAPFRVRPAGDVTLLDPASYHRYDGYAAAVDGLDATGTARLYLTLKPRILDAYRTQGFPDGDFDPVLGKAIAGLLAVPSIDRDIPVREKIVTYAFVDPALEELSPAQKQLLRMGPRNIGLVQQKLRQIATLLGLHTDPMTVRP